LRPGYADTLKWYYRRAKSSQDKEYCLKLLTKLELQKQSEQKQPHSKSKRPETAPLKQVTTQPKSSQKLTEKPKAPTPPHQDKPKTREAEKKKERKTTTTYQQQLAFSQRLSRPKTVRYCVEQKNQSNETQQKRPKSAMADLGKLAFKSFAS